MSTHRTRDDALRAQQIFLSAIVNSLYEMGPWPVVSLTPTGQERCVFCKRIGHRAACPGLRVQWLLTELESICDLRVVEIVEDPVVFAPLLQQLRAVEWPLYYTVQGGGRRCVSCGAKMNRGVAAEHEAECPNFDISWMLRSLARAEADLARMEGA